MSKDNKDTVLKKLDKVIIERKNNMSENSYVSSLFIKGDKYIRSKVLEEANEFIEAVSENDRKHIIHEAADLWFHTLVSLSLNEISSDDILKELENRFGQSGLEEKRLRNK